MERPCHLLRPRVHWVFFKEFSQVIDPALSPSKKPSLGGRVLVAQNEHEPKNHHKHKNRNAANHKIGGHLACGNQNNKANEHDNGKAAKKSDFFQKDNCYRFAHVKALFMRPSGNQNAASRPARWRHVVCKSNRKNKRNYMKIRNFLVNASEQLFVCVRVPKIAPKQTNARANKRN